jgi:hypothetical protein
MFWYLATPYSKYPQGTHLAFEDACREAALLIRAGIRVYSPIAHTHPVAMFGDIDPLDHTIWLAADEPFMRAAGGLIVCKLEGWDSSYGIAVEIQHFLDAGKPIVYMTPGSVPELEPKRQIIGLCGYAMSGKDEAAKALVADGWKRVAFADAVREALLALDPEISLATLSSYLSHWETWDELKRQIPAVRLLLQRMGTEAGRNIHGANCWVNIARRKIEATTADVVVTDVRFANEAAMIRGMGGKVVRINRPGVGPVNSHASEALEFDADYTLENDGTVVDLHDAIRELVGVPA